ncbi:MAG: hypothetical protein ACFE7R_08695 [Candidatus Hodarchaeota archaeon]
MSSTGVLQRPSSVITPATKGVIKDCGYVIVLWKRNWQKGNMVG